MTPPIPPERIDTPAAWRAGDLRPGEWAHALSPVEITEIEAAARALAAKGADLGALIADEDFAIPQLAPRLRAILDDEVLGGRGFAVLSGLDPGRLTRAENAALFMGIGAHLGAARPQNAKGHLLGHVKDLGRSSSDPTARIYQTNERQTFHTDSADVEGLMCLQPAKRGGRSSLVSSVAIHNAMRATASWWSTCSNLSRPTGAARRPTVSVPISPSLCSTGSREISPASSSVSTSNPRAASMAWRHRARTNAQRWTFSTPAPTIRPSTSRSTSIRATSSW